VRVGFGLLSVIRSSANSVAGEENLVEKQRKTMDKIFGPAYSGDPGIPHSQEPFYTTIGGPLVFSVVSIFNPYYWQSTTEYNWHDWAMVCENTQWKRALKKKQPYEFKFNKFLDKTVREAYYHNWTTFFP